MDAWGSWMNLYIAASWFVIKLEKIVMFVVDKYKKKMREKERVACQIIKYML